MMQSLDEQCYGNLSVEVLIQEVKQEHQLWIHSCFHIENFVVEKKRTVLLGLLVLTCDRIEIVLYDHQTMGLSFPSSLTDEEKLLQHKYAQLRRKKAQIQSLKTPKVETPPPPTVMTPVVKRSLSSDTGLGKADAKEVAKKLLKSGAISAIKVLEKKDAGFVRKRTMSSRVGDKPGGYKPFSANTSIDDSEDDVFISGIPSDPNPAPDYSAKFNSLGSSSTMSAKDAEVIAREETMLEKKREGKQHYVNRDLPNQGNTIYIRAPGLTEVSLRKYVFSCLMLKTLYWFLSCQQQSL